MEGPIVSIATLYVSLSVHLGPSIFSYSISAELSGK